MRRCFCIPTPPPQHGLTVVNRDLGGIRERYDVVSFMNVLSHVACPIGFYRALARLLVADGCLFMCTGNAADLEDPDQNPSKSYSLPDHVVFGGLRHSVQLMEQVCVWPGCAWACAEHDSSFGDNTGTLVPMGTHVVAAWPM